MSDTWQGAGWWQASDGKWYPPETAPQAWPPAPAATQPQPTYAPAPAPTPILEAGPTFAPEAAPSGGAVRWEYHASIGSVMAGDTSFLDQLDSLGNQGWEVVSVVPLEANQHAAILKRHRTD